ncbi:hypothetical protein ACFFJX_20345 [Pseudarcicella hirudinis]|uniref:hypothetical protein n=1 Tax=Pseudarcicella hirudinis TaxID=1079859 RepID=UPI0035EFEA4B
MHYFRLMNRSFWQKNIPGATFQTIDSLYGHDGFLIEKQLNYQGNPPLAKKLTKLEINPMEEFFSGI